MARARVIVDFDTPDDAKKVEETVKTGYAETTVENIINWVAVEQDLVETYARLGNGSDARAKVYRELHDQSKENIDKLSKLLETFEAMDRARIRRIEALGTLLA